MRLFAALEVPPPVEAGLGDWWIAARARFDPQHWRAVKPSRWHLTLAFYGEVGGREVDELAESLAACAADSPPLALCCRGYGLFPRPQRPQVFWAGVEDVATDASIKHLARCCRQAGHVTVRRHMQERHRFGGILHWCDAGMTMLQFLLHRI